MSYPERGTWEASEGLEAGIPMATGCTCDPAPGMVAFTVGSGGAGEAPGVAAGPGGTATVPGGAAAAGGGGGGVKLDRGSCSGMYAGGTT